MAQNKNKGPLLTSTFRGSLEAYSRRWLTKLGFVRTEQKSPTDVTPTAIDATASPTIAESTTIQDQTNERNKIVTTLSTTPGDATITEKLMVEGLEATRTVSLPIEGTALPALAITTVESTQEALGNGRAEQKVTAVSAWPSRSYQELDRQTGIVTAGTIQRVAVGTGVGSALTESVPESDRQTTAIMKTVTVNIAAIETFYATFPGTFRLPLPDELTGVDVVWETSAAIGDYSEDVAGTAVGDNAQLSLSVRGNSSASGSAMPEIIPHYTSRGGDAVPYIDYYFFLPTPVSRSAILSKVSTLTGDSVIQWPVLRARSETFVLRGQKVSVDANVSVTSSLSLVDSNNSATASQGRGNSGDVASSVRAVTLPPTIHGAINLSDVSRLINVGADSQIVLQGNGGFPSASATSSPQGQAQGSVTPTSLTATTPSIIPTSGLYLYESNCELYKDGYTTIRARIIDASQF